MKHIAIVLLLAFSLLTSGCTAALLLGAGGAAGYFGAKSMELEKENERLKAK